MEKDIFTIADNNILKIESQKFDNEKSLQDIIEQLIKTEKKLLSYKIIGYKREHKTNSGRPDFILVDTDGRIIIIECKIINNEQIRRKIIAQLIDYASDYSDLLKITDWISLSGEKVEVDLENNEPILCIISDAVHPELHRVGLFLKSKNFDIKMITLNKFNIMSHEYYTITPHETEPYSLNESLIEKMNIKIASFGKDAENIRSIINIARERFPNIVIKLGKKRIAIHVSGSEEKFALWLSQEGIRSIDKTNISIPKIGFEPCSEASYKAVTDSIKKIVDIIEINHDDVMYYIPIDGIIDSIVKLFEVVSDNIK